MLCTSPCVFVQVCRRTAAPALTRFCACAQMPPCLCFARPRVVVPVYLLRPRVPVRVHLHCGAAQVAMYFAFLAHFTTWLWAPALLGLGAFIHQEVTHTTSISWLPALGILMTLWSTAFVEVRWWRGSGGGGGGCGPCSYGGERTRTPRHCGCGARGAGGVGGGMRGGRESGTAGACAVVLL